MNQDDNCFIITGIRADVSRLGTYGGTVTQAIAPIAVRGTGFPKICSRLLFPQMAC
jgi:hypothetical protein